MRTQRIFRIFVSSTFDDLILERNALQKEVFPKLRLLCKNNGAAFQVVDLRWGISTEASLDQKTPLICMKEIDRSKRISPRPYFITILGDRIGWRPLPPKINGDEFEKIITFVKKKNDKKKISLLEAWYKKDLNAVPSEYVLQPRLIGSEFEKRENWASVENNIKEILTDSVSTLNISEKESFKYISSVTEQEIYKGCLTCSDASEHVFAFFRKINGLPINQSAKKFRDFGNDGKPDFAASKRLEELKHKIKNILPENTFEYDSQWMGKEGTPITDNHINKFSNDVYETLSKIILNEIKILKAETEFELEERSHRIFAEERALNFTGRDLYIKMIMDYFRNNNIKTPFVIYGIGGTGKSALMAKISILARQDFDRSIILLRHIGVTPKSSHISQLLSSLVSKIYQLYGINERIPIDYKELVDAFKKSLTKVKKDKPLIIILDALDQLSKSDNPEQLLWFPEKLPENVSIIISTLPGNYLEALKTKISQENILELKGFQITEAEKLLNVLLKSSGRTLLERQTKSLLENFTKASGNPLYVKMAFERASNWKSYDTDIVLPSDIKGLIIDLFKWMSEKSNHGKLLVSKSVSYLVCAKNGLTEDELLDILSLDDEYWNDFIKDTYHQISERKIPSIVWSRFLFDIEPYVTERNADGTTVLTFFHRVFTETAMDYYLKDKIKNNYYKKLVDYFGGPLQPLLTEGAGRDGINARRLSELPHSIIKTRQWSEIKDILTDANFIMAKMEIGAIGDLFIDYENALSLMNDTVKEKKVISEFFRFIKAKTHIFREMPLLFLQEAFNEPESLILHKSAENTLSDSKTIFNSVQKVLRPRMWLEWKKKSKSEQGNKDPCLMVLLGHKDRLWSCDWSKDGSKIASTAFDDTVRVWDAKSGEEKWVTKHWGVRVKHCSFSPDSSLLIVSAENRDGKLRIYDSNTGTEKIVLDSGKEGEAVCLLAIFSPDGKTIASVSENKSVYIWDVISKKVITIPLKELEFINELAFSPDNKILAGAVGKLIRFWDAKSREELFEIKDLSSTAMSIDFSFDGKLIAIGCFDENTYIFNIQTDNELILNQKLILKGPYPGIRGCAFSPDCKNLVTVASYGGVILWNLSFPDKPISLVGHTRDVICVTYSPDGNAFVTGSDDKNLRIWDAKVKPDITETKIDQKKKRDYTASDISCDGNTITFGLNNGEIKVLDLKSGSEKILIGHENAPTAIGLSKDGKTLYSADFRKTIRKWDIVSGKQISQTQGYDWQVHHIVVSPNEKTFATIGQDGKVVLWKCDDPSIIWISERDHENPGAQCDFSPDGKQIASVGYKTLMICDIADGKQLARSNQFAHYTSAESCKYSPDGKLIVSGDYDGIIRLWDLNCKEIAKIKGHKGSIEGIAFINDGTILITASNDQTLRLWDLKTNEELTRFSTLRPIEVFNVVEKKIIGMDRDGNTIILEIKDK